MVSVWFWDGLDIVGWFGDGLGVVGCGWEWFGDGLGLAWGWFGTGLGLVWGRFGLVLGVKFGGRFGLVLGVKKRVTRDSLNKRPRVVGSCQKARRSRGGSMGYPPIDLAFCQAIWLRPFAFVIVFQARSF